MGKSLEWLKEQVDQVVFDDKLFRVYVSDDKYIFGAHLANDKGPNYFSLSTIYDSIVMLNKYIRMSFDLAAQCEPTENLLEHDMIGKPPANEVVAIYYIENMIFRIETLWDLLAQLCNEFWLTRFPIEKLYAENFFHNLQQGQNAKVFAKEIYQYFKEEEELKDDTEFWKGNYKYIKEYRNKMTHRNSPSIATMSNFDFFFRPPTMFVLKRATEVYIKVSEFIKEILDEIKEYFSNNNIFGDR